MFKRNRNALGEIDLINYFYCCHKDPERVIET